MSTRGAWWHKAPCKIHLDMHCPEWDPSILSAFDAGAVAAAAARTGSEAIYFFAKDHYGNCYYDTRVGHKHGCIGERDLLSEMVAAGHEAGLKVVAYYSVVWDIHAGMAHPDWCQRDAHGRTIPDVSREENMRKWLSLCLNTGYLDYSKAVLTEVAEGYEVDGFHLDMFHLDFGNLSCFCQDCVGGYRALHGEDPPREPTWDAAWRAFVQFRFDSVDRWMHELVGAIHAVHPGMFATTNYHGSPGFNFGVGQTPVRHARASTLLTGETYTPVFGDMYPGMEARFLRGLDREKPMELVCWRMNRITDFTTKPLAQFRWEALTALVNGASVMVIDQPFADGSLDPVAYDAMARVFREVHEKYPSFAGHAERHVGLYYSQKTRDFYGREDGFRYQGAVAGAYKALVESHVQVGFVFDEHVTLDELASYPVVVLPNVAILSREECARLEQYVNQGGYLVATQDTSRFDEDGEPLENFRLSKLLGVDFEAVVANRWHFWRGLAAPYGDDIDPRCHVLCDGPAVRVRATTAAAHGDLHDAFHRQAPPEHFYSHSVHPPGARAGSVVHVNGYGAGTAVYLATPCGRNYADDHEQPEHRVLLRNVVRAAGHTPLVTVEHAPLTVDCQVLRDGDTLWLHLLSFHATRQSAAMGSFGTARRPSLRMDEPILYRARIRVNRPFQAVSAVDGARITGDGPVVDVLGHDVHHVIEIRLGRGKGRG